MPATDKIRRVERALADLASNEADCRLCPRDCRVDRRRGLTGYCGIGARAVVSTALLHFGEEPVLSGTGNCGTKETPAEAPGSGTVFFSGCNLRCLFCQNYQISWQRGGREVGDEELAGMMLVLQEQGAANLNLVSPSHVLLPILRALRLALQRGFSLPVVYNTNGYDNIEIIERLNGIVDVYLPDCKYTRPEPAARYSGAADYFDKARAAIQDMFVQKPDLICNDRGLAVSGTIVRHLVLPGQVADSLAVLDWLAETFRPTIPLSLMSQYRPCWKAPVELRRGLRPEEYRMVLLKAKSSGFDPLFAQPNLFEAEDHLNPDFERDEPFRWKPS
ncbi:MAG: radical SAM protein [Candidatus Aminicenantes bacterium]|nr:radical SAM protein [Candidatus Aminicenantes bacterium]